MIKNPSRGSALAHPHTSLRAKRSNPYGNSNKSGLLRRVAPRNDVEAVPANAGTTKGLRLIYGLEKVPIRPVA
ncbi:MAG: hypothetical protein WA820_13595, partial [Bradyrhizobium sp.]